MASPRDRSIAAPNSVTIFGGGIAGLTAAHELIERNFKVGWSGSRVSTAGTPTPVATIGGMARTRSGGGGRLAATTETGGHRTAPERDRGRTREARAVKRLPRTASIFFKDTRRREAPRCSGAGAGLPGAERALRSGEGHRRIPGERRGQSRRSVACTAKVQQREDGGLDKDPDRPDVSLVRAILAPRQERGSRGDVGPRPRGASGATCLRSR